MGHSVVGNLIKLALEALKDAFEPVETQIFVMIPQAGFCLNLCVDHFLLCLERKQYEIHLCFWLVLELALLLVIVLVLEWAMAQALELAMALELVLAL